MLLDFYKLREQPFGVTPDPSFLFLGESHREALASLFCSIDSDRGFMALIAHPGMGKTTLAFQLLEKLERSARTIFLFQTQCNSRELFQYVLNDLDVDCAGMDIVSMHNKLNDVLCAERQRGRRVVLVIDEAQNLEPAVLETIRLLSNFETPRAKLLQIVLIGQPQLARKLADPALLQLEQRIATLARIEPFSAQDTERYIEYRLRMAGYAGEALFTREAVALIAERSHGIPRNINTLCFNSLSLGCAMRRNTIDADMIREVLADLNLESVGRRDTNLSAAPETFVEPVLFRNQKGSSRSLKIAAIGLAACISGGILLSYSGVKTNWWPRFTEIVSTRRASHRADVADSVVNNVATNTITQDALTSTYAPEMPKGASQLQDNSKTIKVTVQSGETLRQITLRTLGKYNPRLIAKIQSMNAGITNPNRIETNQEIRLPQPSKSYISAHASDTDAIPDKN